MATSRRTCISAISRLAAPLLTCGLLWTSGVMAQQAGDIVVQIGWVHVGTLSSHTRVHTDLRPSLAGTLLGVPDSFDSPNLSAQPHSVNTLGNVFSYFLTDHAALELDLGIPPKLEIDGHGVAAPPGLTGQLFRINLDDPAYKPIGSAVQWSPALVLHWRFRDPSARLRPYVGAGVAYSWFRRSEINPAFAAALNSSFGSELALAAGKPGQTHVDSHTLPAWAPVLNGGLSCALGLRWGLNATLAYVPLSTTTVFNLDAADGTQLAQTHVRVKAKALLSALLLSYRF